MTYKVTVTEDVTSVSVSGNTTSINLTGEQTEISVVNPATSVTFNPSQSFTSTNVQDALLEAHKMIGQQTNDYSVTLDYGNKFEIQSGSDFARFDLDGSSQGLFANITSSDKMSFITDGNLNALLDNSGSTFYDKLEVEGNPSIDDGLIQTNKKSGTQQHHIEMKNDGSTVGFLGSDGDSAFLGISSASVAVSSAGIFGGDLSPATQYGANKNGVIDLGKDNSRFRSLYLSDTAYVRDEVEVDSNLHLNCSFSASGNDGNIIVDDGSLYLTANGSGASVIANADSGVILQHDGSTKINTRSSGVTIHGYTAFQGDLSSSGYLEVIDKIYAPELESYYSDLIIQSTDTSGKVEIKGTDQYDNTTTNFSAEGNSAAMKGNGITNFSAEGNSAVMKGNGLAKITVSSLIVDVDSVLRASSLWISNGINFGGAVNSGGTVSSSNTLDDYEEGTWTPSFTADVGGSVSFTKVQATYTKIGNQVYLQAYLTDIAGTSHNAVGGRLIIWQLPFTVSKTGFFDVSNCNIFSFDESSTNVSGYVSPANYIVLQKGSSRNNVTPSDLTDIGTMNFHAVYTTTD